MTKTSLPGCMQSVLVSCPYEVWGPSQLCQPHPPCPSQAESPEEEEGGLVKGVEGVTLAHTLSCLALMDISHTQPHKLIWDS